MLPVVVVVDRVVMKKYRGTGSLASRVCCSCLGLLCCLEMLLLCRLKIIFYSLSETSGVYVGATRPHTKIKFSIVQQNCPILMIQSLLVVVV